MSEHVCGSEINQEASGDATTDNDSEGRDVYQDEGAYLIYRKSPQCFYIVETSEISENSAIYIWSRCQNS